MGTYTKIKTIPLSIFNNAEYLAFLNSVLNLVPAPTGGGDRPEIESLDTDVRTNGSPDIGLVIYITTRISRAGTLPLEAERDAGKFLYKVIKPYIGIARLPVAQETAKIQGLLIDLRKDENATYVTTLGLEAYLAELEKENNAYIALTSARTQSRAANKKDNSATIRQRLDSQYDDLVMLAQSFSVAQPSAAATTFVSNLNQLISETVTAFNQRKKGSGPAGEGGGGSSDRPEIE